MSELAIAWPRLPAPNRAMLCWPEVRRILRISRDQRVDVVADAALAELAEAGEVAADLGRVDVRVLGELLRGDRLAAHLAGLDQHLQVAREPRRDAEREPVAVGDGRRGPRRRRSTRWCVRVAHGATVSSAGANGVAVEVSSLTTHAVDLDHRDPLEQSPRAARRRSRCRPRAARSGALAAQRDEPLARLVAEVAAGPRVEGHDARRPCGLTLRRPRRVEVVGIGERRRRNRAAEAIIAALSVQSSRGDQLQRAGPRSLAELARPARAAARWRRRRRRARRRRHVAARSQRPRRASRPAARRPPPGSSPRGRRGARDPARGRARGPRRASAVFRPLKLKSSRGSSAHRDRERRTPPGRRPRATRSIAGPPG